MRIIGYTRVSTEEQSTNGVSLAAQEAKLRAYADLYGHEVIAVVVDAGHSAKTLDRPGLNQVLEALTSGEAEGAIVMKLDRLTRSVRDLGALLDEYFQHFALISVGEQVDTTTAGGRLVLNLLTSVSQWEREVISERTSAALQHKKANGVKLGAPALDNPAALARVRELNAQGYSLRYIACALQREGFETLRGGNWSGNHVSRMLNRSDEAGE